MRRALPYLTVLLAIAVAGYTQGRRTVDSRALRAAVARLERVPLVVGAWQGEAQTIDPHELVVGKIDGFLLRRYVNRDGTALMLLLVCGRPGPISVHTPDICYAGAGYVLNAGVSRFSVPGAAAAQVWVGDFHNESPVPKPPLRILWSWNGGTGGWQAPEWPRMTFAPRPFLYKLYVVREVNPTGPPPLAKDPSVEFLQTMLPVLDATLTPRAAPASADHA